MMPLHRAGVDPSFTESSRFEGDGGTKKMTISFQGRVTLPKDVLLSGVQGESVLLNLKSERYFGLDEVGTRMLSVLTESNSVQAAYDTLLKEYDVEADALRQDLTSLIDKLIDQGLVEMAGE